MARAPARLPQGPHGSRLSQTAVRLAIEGIPLAVIARALLCPLWEVKYACAEARSKGYLDRLPPHNWPEDAARVPTRLPARTASRLPSAEIAGLAERLRIFMGLRYGESVLLATMMLVDVAEKGTMSRLVAKHEESPTRKLIDTVACHLRNALRPHDIAFETIWGVGYRMPADQKPKVAALLDKATGGARDAA